MPQDLTQVTIIYYHEESLELLHEVKLLPLNEEGRVVIAEAFKVGKSIIAVCAGDIRILNKVGDRILPTANVA